MADMQDDKVGQPAVAQTQMTVYRWEVNIPAKAEPAEVAKTLGCTVASAEQAQELGFPWTELQEFCDVAFKIKGLQPREAVKILVSGYDKLEQQLGLNRLLDGGPGRRIADRWRHQLLCQSRHRVHHRGRREHRDGCGVCGRRRRH